MSNAAREIEEIINSLNTSFTVSSVHKIYAHKHPELSLDSKSSRQLVYRSITKLEGIGQVARMKGTSGNAVHYFKLDPATTNSHEQFSNTLHKKHNFYKMEFLQSLGELEIIKELQSEPGSPELILAKHYEEAEEKSGKLLGKIKTIEQLISNSMLGGNDETANLAK